MKKHLFVLTICLELSGLFALPAHAQTSPDLVVTPVVIDEKVKQRDIVKESIMVKNNTNHVLDLYPSVNDINPQLGEQGFSRADDSTALSDSLANWIELSRGEIQLGPGEEKAVPFIIRVNMNAVANSYHAQISLTAGGTRAEADSKPPLGVIMVNVEVQADIKELLQLNKFTTDNIFFSGDDVLFNYQLQNIGNQNLAPKGQVHIYNRKGEEVATVDVNKDGKVISPDQVSQLASVWSAANGFGRYKALLTVNYGSSQTATVQDTVFFWIVPWKQMLLLFTVSLITIIFLALQFHNWLERRHLYKFAQAGLLNDDTIQKLHGVDPLPVAPIMSDPRPVAAPAPAAPNAVAPESIESKHRSLKEVLVKEESPKAPGHAIDLKQLRTQASVTTSSSTPTYVDPTVRIQSAKAEVHGNIISLKKPR